MPPLRKSPLAGTEPADPRSLVHGPDLNLDPDLTHLDVALSELDYLARDLHLGVKMGLVPCLAVSTLTIVLTMFVAQFLRELAAALLPRGSMLLVCVNEFLAAAEMCGCGFELIISEYTTYFLQSEPSLAWFGIQRLRLST